MTLNVGITLDSLLIPDWINRVITEIEAGGFARISLLLLSSAPGRDKPGRSLFRQYCGWDARRHRRRPDALTRRDLTPRIPATQVLPLPAQLPPTADIVKQIRSAQLDVLLHFSTATISAHLYPLVRYGIWVCQLEGRPVATDPAALFWPINRRQKTFTTAVRAFSHPDDAGRVITQSITALQARSITLSQNAACWKASYLVTRGLRDLHRHAGRLTVARGLPAAPPAEPQPGWPGTWQTLCFLGRQGWHRLRRPGALFGEQWGLAMRTLSNGAPAEDFDRATDGFQQVRPPAGHFIADPFPFEWRGETYVFVEESPLRPKKGMIAYFRLDASGKPGPLIRILDKPYHLSYPFVFEWQNEIYMIPESSANRTIELYRAEQFPDRWQLVKVLMKDVFAVDTTLLAHDGKLWMFVNIASEGISDHDELNIFYADALEGPWHPHRANPVVSDVTRARPAGRIYLRGDGKLIRPAQDCSATYGWALNFCEINTLSADTYEETVIARMTPPLFPGNTGVHTYNFTNHYEIIDCKTRCVKPLKAAALGWSWLCQLAGKQPRLPSLAKRDT